MPPPASAGGRDSESASRYCSPCEAGAIYNKIADVRVCFCPPPGGIPSQMFVCRFMLILIPATDSTNVRTGP